MRFDAIRARCHVYAFGHHLVGDRLTGGIYIQSVAYARDIGVSVLRRERQGPHLANNSQWLYYPEIRVLLDSGHLAAIHRRCQPDKVATLPGGKPIGYLGPPELENALNWNFNGDPQVMLQYSDTGGRSWSDERWVSAGKVGEYGHVATFRQLGRSRDRIFRVAVADPVPLRLIDMQSGVGR